MGVNKVEYYGDTLIDLTSDTVTPETLAEGATAHDASGERITGTMPTKTIPNTNDITDLLAFAINCEAGMTPFTTSSGTANIPSNSFAYCSGTVHKRTEKQITVKIFSYQSSMTATNTYNGSAGWTGWCIDDPIVESGTSGIWTYRKYASGIAECWGQTHHSVPINEAWGNIFVSQELPAQTYPITFVDYPHEIPAVSTREGLSTVQTWLAQASTSARSKTTSGIYRVCRPSSYGTAKYYTIVYDVKGRWK